MNCAELRPASVLPTNPTNLTTILFLFPAILHVLESSNCLKIIWKNAPKIIRAIKTNAIEKTHKKTLLNLINSKLIIDQD